MFRRIVKTLIPRRLFRRIEPYGHLVETFLANLYYGFPARGLKVIGVTGTDGKTTTTTLIWTMMKQAGYKAGYMTTIGYGTPQWQRYNKVHMTSMQAFPLMSRIKAMRAAGIEWLVLETTSHALAQNRVWGVPFSVAVMTNVNHEHLDYHGTFERYRDAKRRMFQLAADNRAGLQTGIINAEDPSADLFAADVPSSILYGIDGGSVKATNITATPTGSEYTVKRGNSTLHINLHLPARFNVYNSLAAVSTGIAVGLTNKQIEQGIAALGNVEGRMTKVEEGQDYHVIVDFAHTPASFEKLLSDMRSQVKAPQKLIVMFGSAGRRDEAKRAIQGGIAGHYADIVVITEEDDRDIDGQGIVEQIATGAETSGKVRDKNLFLVHDRSEAIAFAMQQASSGDTVMLLGKGHETTIERGGGEEPWNELAEAKQAIHNKRKT
ncbi:MAG TPA: UDP-N-acetylmuramyl-tripeptide synthetase [Candidatus Saccharimonadia bacterium]